MKTTNDVYIARWLLEANAMDKCRVRDYIRSITGDTSTAAEKATVRNDMSRMLGGVLKNGRYNRHG